MAELSRDEVVAILGPVSDIVAAQVISTGITKPELVAAHDRVVKDRRVHVHGPKLTPGPVAKVVELLERLSHEGLLGEGGSKLQ
jgi:hypothetical protein